MSASGANGRRAGAAAGAGLISGRGAGSSGSGRMLAGRWLLCLCWADSRGRLVRGGSCDQSGVLSLPPEQAALVFQCRTAMQCGEGLGSSILSSYGATRRRDAARPSSGHGAASSIPQQQHDGLCGPCGACGRLMLLCSLPWGLLELDASSLFHGGLLDWISCAKTGGWRGAAG